MSRLPLLLVVVGCLVGVQRSWTQQPDLRLEVVPAKVYKVDDPGGASTSSFAFNIAVLCSTDCGLTPISARVELSSAMGGSANNANNMIATPSLTASAKPAHLIGSQPWRPFSYS